MGNIKFVVAPDFAPQRTPCLQIFSTLLSKHSGLSVQQTITLAPDEVEQAVKEGVDLIYCNPFLALRLYEENGYVPVLRPIGDDACDNVACITAADGPIKSLGDLKPGMTCASPSNIGVKTIAEFMNKGLKLGLVFIDCDNAQQAVQKVVRQEAETGLILWQTFNDLSGLTRSRLKDLDHTDLPGMGYPDIRRVLLAKTDPDTLEAIKKAIIGFKDSPDAGEMLERLGVKEGFEAITPDMAEATIANIKKMAAIANS